ncbi:DUF6077 domain-containing protein [Aristaeella hokkaidonensis]|uniref:Uncharacterized protein n=1 Tax=Aristaeella hokkaidonensis TaxID=3046382 RepID=A0AC61MVQ6_9FIRM|nr:DUF6077 domain-containing protein [Aristaeella hokkaidonensis]QUC66685.1 hypothetical protein JYE49_12635 [Aristaeella hokkaidonensis]SNT94658.1 hypothetical protein SAMN06297421_10669 [Aristaeella hokkaidonensis]
MREAVLPFLGYAILQLIVIVAGLNIIGEKEIRWTGLLKSWITGQMLLFAALQVLAVSMILLRWEFSVLFWTFCGVVIVLFGLGIRKIKRIKLTIHKLSPIALVFLVASILLILSQAGIYFFGMHLDEDDARWLAEANDAIETGDMMTRSYHTGELLGKFAEMRDVVSPWPMLFAILSRVLFTRVSIVAHTIYPTVEIILVYGIYYLIASELLQKSEARLTFVLFAALIQYFYGGSVYTQGTFSLIRIWQGKASVAAVIIPLLFYFFISVNKKNRTRDWIYIALVGLAGCLMSGMGISITLILIGVYGVYNILAYQNWKRIPFFIVSVIPSLAFALTYYCLKG